jgi:hypothetical protein
LSRPVFVWPRLASSCLVRSSSGLVWPRLAWSWPAAGTTTKTRPTTRPSVCLALRRRPPSSGAPRPTAPLLLVARPRLASPPRGAGWMNAWLAWRLPPARSPRPLTEAPGKQAALSRGMTLCTEITKKPHMDWTGKKEPKATKRNSSKRSVAARRGIHYDPRPRLPAYRRLCCKALPNRRSE